MRVQVQLMTTSSPVVHGRSRMVVGVPQGWSLCPSTIILITAVKVKSFINTNQIIK